MTRFFVPLMAVGCNGGVFGADPTGWVFEEQQQFDLPGAVTFLVEVDGKLLVAARGGTVTGFQFDGTQLGSFDLAAFESQACGLLSLVPDPDFDDNGFVYYGACASKTRSAVYRATVDLDAWTANDVVEIIAAEDTRASDPWHNVGWLGFDEEGALYALFGDKTRGSNAQDTSSILGSVVRLLPSREAGVGGYTPHADNPFVGMDGHDAIYAWGLRSPWTGAFDDEGRLWVGDVGSNETGWEELNLVDAGSNLGWDDFEGPCTDCGGTVPPVTAWPHESGHRYFNEDPDVVATALRVGWVTSVSGGTGDPYGGRLDGRLLFGDLCLGFVRSIEADAEGNVTADEHLGHMPAAAWVTSPDGYLYGSTLEGCTGNTVGDVSQMYRLNWVDPK